MYIYIYICIYKGAQGGGDTEGSALKGGANKF